MNNSGHINFIKNNLSCGDKIEPQLTVINPLWENLIDLIGHKKLNSHVLDNVNIQDMVVP